MTLTETRAKALRILQEHGPIAPAQFAEEMWPDSDGWDRPHKCGPQAVSEGAGMALAAGGYLGKLRKAGLARVRNSRRLREYGIREYVLTAEGEEKLEAHEDG